MPKKKTKKITKTAKKTVSRRRAVATAVKPTQEWGTDRSMMLLLAAGTIILVVAGMWMAGWL